MLCRTDGRADPYHAWLDRSRGRLSLYITILPSRSRLSIACAPPLPHSPSATACMRCADGHDDEAADPWSWSPHVGSSPACRRSWPAWGAAPPSISPPRRHLMHDGFDRLAGSGANDQLRSGDRSCLDSRIIESCNDEVSTNNEVLRQEVESTR